MRTLVVSVVSFRHHQMAERTFFCGGPTSTLDKWVMIRATMGTCGMATKRSSTFFFWWWPQRTAPGRRDGGSEFDRYAIQSPDQSAPSFHLFSSFLFLYATRLRWKGNEMEIVVGCNVTTYISVSKQPKSQQRNVTGASKELLGDETKDEPYE